MTTPQESRQAERRFWWALALILGAAFVLRFWGIRYGLPLSYWTDEYHELMRAMELGAGSFNFSRITKGGFYLLLFFEYGVYYAFLRVTGAVASTMDFAKQFVADPTAFYLIGRSTAAILGCVTVAAVYWIGRRAYSILAGLVAAGLLAVNVLHVDLSHRIGVDVPMAACAALALYFGLRVAEEGGRRNYVLAALFAALATTTKLPGILVLLPLLVAHSYRVIAQRQGARGWFGRADLWVAFGVFAAIMLATNPGVLAYVGLGDFIGTSGGGEEADDLGDSDPDAPPNLYLYYARVILLSMGWPLFVASLAAVGLALWRRSRADVMLLAYALANYLAIAGTSSESLYYPRYALPIILVLAVLTGRAVAECVQGIARGQALAGTALVALLAAWPLYRVVVADHALTMTDSRTTAKEWFEANVPAGSKVLVEGGKTGPKRESVQLHESRASLEQRIAYWKRAEPRQAKFLEFKLAVDDGSGYELELVQQQSVRSLQAYKSAGVEYFVVRPDYFARSRKAGSGAVELLRDLESDPDVKLLRRFAPESPSQPGDIVDIYHLARSGAAGGN